MFFPVRSLKPKDAVAVDTTWHVIGFVIGVQLRRVAVRRAFLLRDLVFGPGLICAPIIFPPGKRMASRVAKQHIAAPICVEVSKIEVMRTPVRITFSKDVPSKRSMFI